MFSCESTPKKKVAFETFNQYQNLDCLWHSTCRFGDFFSCHLNHMNFRDIWTMQTFNETYQERYACLDGVKSCEDYQSCKTITSLQPAPSCPGTKQIICDEEAGVWMDCDGTFNQPLAEGSTPNVYYDLQAIGASCDGDILSFPTSSCDQIKCNGRAIEGCFLNENGLVLGSTSFDCTQIDPTYSCFQDFTGFFVCGLETTNGCGTDGQSPRTIECKDDTTVSFCERGETYDITCPAGYICTLDALESNCVLF